jgi:hypothetical protein
MGNITVEREKSEERLERAGKERRTWTKQTREADIARGAPVLTSADLRCVRTH